jgi:plastocyanin
VIPAACRPWAAGDLRGEANPLTLGSRIRARESNGRSFMTRIALVSVVVAAITAAAVLASAQAATPVLKGEVGPGFTIEVTKAGKDVKKLKAGTYRIKIEDKANIHNFHLMGPGLNKSTTISFVGEKTWKIKLKPGKYTYQCDPHAFNGMKGTFKVTR